MPAPDNATPAKDKAAKPPKKPAAHREPHAVFLPTLLPDPFGESSPELCWEWRRGEMRVTLRLTQFGWNASAFSDFGATHWKDDQLPGLRDQVIEASLPAPMASAMALPWILAYEAAGL